MLPHPHPHRHHPLNMYLATVGLGVSVGLCVNGHRISYTQRIPLAIPLATVHELHAVHPADVLPQVPEIHPVSIPEWFRQVVSH
jgi:hypothetical protein